MDEAERREFARVVSGGEPSEAVGVAELFYLSFGEKLAGLARRA